MPSSFRTGNSIGIPLKSVCLVSPQCWGRTNHGKAPHNPRPDAARAQAATNGSRILSRVLNPGPSSFRAGGRNAAHHPQQKAADVTRFWLGRSGARRLLGPRNHRRSRDSDVHGSEQSPIACGAFSNEQEGKV